jgi:hypothetical protein
VVGFDERKSCQSEVFRHEENRSKAVRKKALDGPLTFDGTTSTFLQSNTREDLILQAPVDVIQIGSYANYTTLTGTVETRKIDPLGKVERR